MALCGLASLSIRNHCGAVCARFHSAPSVSTVKVVRHNGEEILSRGLWKSVREQGITRQAASAEAELDCFQWTASCHSQSRF